MQSSEKIYQLINRTHLSPEVSVMCAALVCSPVNSRLQGKSACLEMDDLLPFHRQDEIGAKSRWSRLIW